MLNATKPKNIKELRSFLGLINYYRKFLPNLALILEPLNSLLRGNQKYVWTSACDQSFEIVKKLLTTTQVLAHYDADLPVTLATDASAYGVGTVLSHVGKDENERPIAYASRTLSKAESNYHKFHEYLYGRHFLLITDHKPLKTILGPKTGV